MNGTEDAQFPEKENINGIFVAVQYIGFDLGLAYSRTPAYRIAGPKFDTRSHSKELFDKHQWWR